MNLTVLRKYPFTRATLGELRIEGELTCFTLEPPVLPAPAKPRAIPAGQYEVTIRWSPSHHRDVPHVEDVPDFSEIEIHIGNSVKDTRGCLLVGQTLDLIHNSIWGSRIAFVPLFAKLEAALKTEKVYITYEDMDPATEIGTVAMIDG